MMFIIMKIFEIHGLAHLCLFASQFVNMKKIHVGKCILSLAILSEDYFIPHWLCVSTTLLLS